MDDFHLSFCFFFLFSLNGLDAQLCLGHRVGSRQNRVKFFSLIIVGLNIMVYSSEDT